MVRKLKSSLFVEAMSLKASIETTMAAALIREKEGTQVQPTSSALLSRCPNPDPGTPDSTGC